MATSVKAMWEAAIAVKRRLSFSDVGVHHILLLTKLMTMKLDVVVTLVYDRIFKFAKN